MEQKKSKINIKFSLFDLIVLGVVGAIGVIILGLFIWDISRNAEDTYFIEVVYTVRLENTIIDTADHMEVGDVLEDASLSGLLGTLLSYEVKPATTTLLDETTYTMVEVEMLDAEDVELTITCPAKVYKDRIYLPSGAQICVTNWLGVRGPGYLGSGIVVAVDRDSIDDFIDEKVFEEAQEAYKEDSK